MRSSASAIRRFTINDQRDFAQLSGDWNPIHVDPIQARRLLFGEPVVHGIHLVLWALERLAGAAQIAALSVTTAGGDQSPAGPRSISAGTLPAGLTAR